MTFSGLDRRALLQLALGSGAFALLPGLARAQAGGGPAQPFSFDILTGMARDLSKRPYRPQPVGDEEILDQIDYDRHNEIRFLPEKSLWRDRDIGVQVQMFFPGRYFKQPVRIFALDGGMATELPFDTALFDIPQDNPARKLRDTTGFAGFRVLDSATQRDWMAFLGASYWRTSGYSGQFGLSTRGLAIDTAIPDGPEEFPLFTHFWLEPEAGGAMVAYALLDSPSAAGAYRIESRRGDAGVVQDVTARVFMRDAVERLGIAPLTSMFWFGKNSRQLSPDWRPEVHDSDGLQILSGTGEHIWRPLNNPPHTMANVFAAPSIKGFGLMQRERDFQQYQDDGVFYERRASAWVEPQGDWGDGGVTLVELRTDDEIHDNIVAFWQPARPVQAGDEYDLRYRLSWLEDAPIERRIGRFVATRLGAGGIPGQVRPENTVKLVCDFVSDGLTETDGRGAATLNITASRGIVSNDAVYPVVDQPYWRAMFDLSFDAPETAAGGPRDDSPIDLRIFVAKGDQALTETLLLQLFPTQLRKLLASRP